MTAEGSDSRREQIDAAAREAAAARGRLAQWARSGRTLPLPTGSRAGPPAASPPDIPGLQDLCEVQRGGQGVVYRAVQTRTGRTVAVKLMRGGALAGIAERARFEREIRILALLKHPNIVPIFDSGEAGGWHYFVMDFIHGATLDDFVARRGLLPRQTVELMAKICDAVEAAHVRGVIHRDLKPANIRVDDDGAPHVLDFGLAKQPENPETRFDHTQTGQFVGSLPWASPEQVSGSPRGVDMRSDVYSLGVILYRLVTGVHPYPIDGSVREVIERIEQFPPRRPRSVCSALDDDLETILLKCLAKEPERRYQSAGELGRDLRSYLAGDAISAKRDSGWYVLRKQLARHRGALLVALAFVALLALSSIVAWTLYLSSRDRLWDSYLAQARAGQSSQRIGRRIDSLAALQAARAIRSDAALRDEAVACLALRDLRTTASFDGVEQGWTMGLAGVNRFAQTYADGRVTIHVIEDGRTLAQFESPGGRAVMVEFSRDGSHVAVKYATETTASLTVWSIEAGTQRLRLDGPVAGAFGQAAFAPSGDRIAVVDENGFAALHRLDQETPLARAQPGFYVSELTFDPTGRRLALGNHDKPRIVTWDIEQNCIERDLTIPAPPMCLAWSDDNRTLAAGGRDHAVYLFDLSTDAPPRALPGHSGQVVAVVFDRESRRLVSWGWDAQTWIWDVAGGKPLFQPLVGGRFCGMGNDIAHLRDGTLTFYTFVEVDVVREIDLERPGTARFAHFLADPDYLVADDLEGAGVWCTRGNELVARLHDGDLRSLVVSPDRKSVYAVVKGRILRWDIRPNGGDVCVDGPHSVAASLRAHDISLSPDGRRMVVSGAHQTQVLDLDSGAVIFDQASPWGTIEPVLSPDGRHAFLGHWKGEERAAQLIRLDGREVRRFSGEHVVGRFSPDGESLAISRPTAVEVESVAGGVQRFRLARKAGQNSAGPVAFSHDGSMLALTGSTYEVQLVDGRTGEILVRLPNPRLHLVCDLDFSDDGRFLLVTTSAQFIYVWDLGALRRELDMLRLDW